MTHLAFLLFAVALAILPACKAADQPTPSPAAAPATNAGIDRAGMDTSVAPGDDFYAYANGTWLKNTEIPPDKSGYGPGNVLADETRKQVVDLIQESAKAGAGASADARRVGDFYASFMDEAAIESHGIAPLRPKLDAVAAIADKTALARAIGGTLRADVDPLNATNFQTENLLGAFVSQGLMDPDHNVPYLLQGGLGLPDRDYYISKSPRMAELRKQYQAHVEAMLKLAGFTDAPARAARILALETKIAEKHATRTESANVKLPAVWKREEFAKKAPGIDWPAMFEAASLKDPAEFIIWHPKAVTGISTLFAAEPLDAWKDWLAFHTIGLAANFLPKAFVDERFAFFGKVLTGTLEQRPRWQRGVDYTGAALGEAVGKLYVQRHFPPESKAKVQAMVNDLVQAFNRRIDSLDWMAAETKRKAKEKVATLKVGVGYPDKWQDYSGLDVVKRRCPGQRPARGIVRVPAAAGKAETAGR